MPRQASTWKSIQGLDVIALSVSPADALGLECDHSDPDVSAMLHAIAGALDYAQYCLFEHPAGEIQAPAVLAASKPRGAGLWIAPLALTPDDRVKAAAALLADGARGYAVACEAWVMLPGERLDALELYGCAANGMATSVIHEILRDPAGRPTDLRFRADLCARGRIGGGGMSAAGPLTDLFGIREAAALAARHGLN